jgi:hypothetical protein
MSTYLLYPLVYMYIYLLCLFIYYIHSSAMSTYLLCRPLIYYVHLSTTMSTYLLCPLIYYVHLSTMSTYLLLLCPLIWYVHLSGMSTYLVCPLIWYVYLTYLVCPLIYCVHLSIIYVHLSTTLLTEIKLWREKLLFLFLQLSSSYLHMCSTCLGVCINVRHEL